MLQVRGVVYTGREQEMYDIQMEGIPVYYSQGLLVHNSNNNLAEALATKGLDTGVRTDKGAMKLDKASMAALKHPLIEKIARRKYIKKQLSTYIIKFTEISTGKIQYKLFDTATARLSSGNDLSKKSRANYYYLPLNAQNLTKAGPGYYKAFKSDSKDAILGWEFTYLTDDKDAFSAIKKANPDDTYAEGFSQTLNLRNAIKAPDGFILSSIDFSAQELKVLGMLCLLYSQEVQTNFGKITLAEVKTLINQGATVLVETPIGLKKVTAFLDVGKKAKCTLTLSNGTVIYCSDMELFFVKDKLDGVFKFVRFKHLIKGRHLLVETSDNIDSSVIKEALSTIDYSV